GIVLYIAMSLTNRRDFVDDWRGWQPDPAGPGQRCEPARFGRHPRVHSGCCGAVSQPRRCMDRSRGNQAKAPSVSVFNPDGRTVMPVPVLLLVALLLVLPGCATDAPATGMDAAQMQLPQRDADLYPWAEKQEGVVVAVDEIVQPARLEQYFGVDLLEHGILPIAVVVSNRSAGPVTIGPADVLLVQGRNVIDPLPLARVAGAIDAGGGNADSADLRAHLAGMALQPVTLAPNESHQGVLFFP